MNSIDVNVDFSFQGKHYTPVITIDLDNYIQQKEQSSLHRLIADHHEIDCYSYLYEMMESIDIFYRNPQGLAVNHTKDGYFDIDSYRLQWEDEKIIEQLLHIAQDEMDITDFDNNKSLINALLKAYKLGCSQI